MNPAGSTEQGAFRIWLQAILSSVLHADILIMFIVGTILGILLWDLFRGKR